MPSPETTDEAIAIRAACDEFNINMAPCDWPVCGCTDDGSEKDNPMVGVARRVLRALNPPPKSDAEPHLVFRIKDRPQFAELLWDLT